MTKEIEKDTKVCSIFAEEESDWGCKYAFTTNKPIPIEKYDIIINFIETTMNDKVSENKGLFTNRDLIKEFEEIFLK